MGPPVVFLAFANDNDNHLSLLDLERKKVCELLIPLESQQHFQLFREPTVTVEDIFKYFGLFKDRLVIFHYGGHASSNKLFLHEEEAHSEGIANLLKQQQNLQLVFLNGCSTKEQVTLLLALGVPAVIATSVPINDRKAADFSIQFYQALIQQYSLKDAFEMASAYLKTKGDPPAEIYRSIISKEDFKSSGDTLPWGLYIASDDSNILEWKLPNKSFREIVVQSASSKYNVKDVPINETLTKVLLEALSEYSDELEFLQFQAAKGKKIDIRKVRRGIMDCLPSPVGEQVRKLFAADPESNQLKLDTISNTRLEQLVVTYTTFTELVNFILLSQLWDQAVQQPDILNKTVTEEFKAFLVNKSGHIPNINLNLIKYLLAFFQERKITCFTEELDDLDNVFKTDEAFNDAHTFLQNLLKVVADKTTLGVEELEQACLLAEIHLGHIFDKFGFCAKYNLTTVKGIDLIKSRHQAASYRHYKVHLDNVTAGYLDIEETYPKFTDANSVLLQKEADGVQTYLNLSPFIIDENALKGEKKSKLFFFSHYDSGSDSYYYHFVNNRDNILVISAQKYPDIKLQFESFYSNLFGSKIQQI